MKRLRLLAAAALTLLCGAGCSNVPYYQKEALGRRLMQLDDNPLGGAFWSKIYASREVSGGRPGASAGGGCGCN